MGTDMRPDISIPTPLIYMGSELLHMMHYTPNGIIATLNICFYFIPCRTTRPIHAKLHLNETVQTDTEIDKTKTPLYSSRDVAFGQRKRNGNETEKK